MANAGRVPPLAGADARISGTEVAVLLLVGVVAAAATAFIRPGLRIPGHSVVLSVFPMALGLALAPRRLAGSIMSTGALATAWLLVTSGSARYGVGALTSLCLTGPLLDVALIGACQGWRLYLRLVLAGVVSNVLAFASRSAAKLIGLDLPGTRQFGEWWPQAVATYALSGAVAGLLSAAIWFQLRKRRDLPR
jgi:hypothetical protein